MITKLMTNYKKFASMFASLALLVSSIAIPAQAQVAEDGCDEDSVLLYSGTSTLADGAAAVETYVHPLWTASIPGATWIWDAAVVADPEATSTVSFTQEFTVNDTISAAELTLAADNEYAVYVNGSFVASSSDITYNAPDTLDLSAYVEEGENTLRIDVTNYALEGAIDGMANPAGLLFSLDVTAGSCDGSEDGKAWINVIKTVSGSDDLASDFTINVSALGVSTSSATSSVNLLSIPGSSTGTLLTVAPGAYSITESAAAGFSVDYSTDCSGEILAGETVTCTITNTALADEPVMGHINVIKQVVNDDEGDSVAADFRLTVNGSGVATTTATSTLSSVEIIGSAAGTMVHVLPGAYSITEADYDGYEASFSAGCSGTVEAGQTVTCVVTNNDIEDDDDGSTSGNNPNINNNVNVNVDPNIEVNPTFYNIAGRGWISGEFDWDDWRDLFDNGSVLGAATTDLSCGPSTRTVATGQLVRFTATGGSGNYVWTAPQMAARTGNELTVFYNTPGTSSVTVTSGGQSETCNVVIAGSVLGDTTNPGLPNTGAGGTLLLNMGVVLALSGITTMVLRKRAMR